MGLRGFFHGGIGRVGTGGGDGQRCGTAHRAKRRPGPTAFCEHRQQDLPPSTRGTQPQPARMGAGFVSGQCPVAAEGDPADGAADPDCKASFGSECRHFGLCIGTRHPERTGMDGSRARAHSQRSDPICPDCGHRKNDGDGGRSGQPQRPLCRCGERRCLAFVGRRRQLHADLRQRPIPGHRRACARPEQPQAAVGRHWRAQRFGRQLFGRGLVSDRQCGCSVACSGRPDQSCAKLSRRQQHRAERAGLQRPQHQQDHRQPQ